MDWLSDIKENFKIKNEELLLEYLDLENDSLNKERFEKVKTILFGNNWIDGKIQECYCDKENKEILNKNQIGLNVFSKEIEKYITTLKLEDFKEELEYLER